MTPIGTTRYIERVRFFDNERLIAPDLQAIDDFARQMRWLHNRSLHQPGVASGYAVAGQKGDSQVVIQPGYAIDALGRELVLTQPYTQPIPPQAGDGQGGSAIFDLTVSYPATLPESESRTADCASATPGAVRLEESPVFCWVSTTSPADKALRTDIQSGLRIVLGRVQVLKCQLYLPISVAQRTDARPSVHPFLYAATATPTWKVNPGNPFGLELVPAGDGTVNATAAGFRTPPAYFVNLISDTSITLPGQPQPVRLEVFASISSPTLVGFQLSLLIPNLVLLSAGLSPAAVQTALGMPNWTIEWMGVES